MKGIVAAGALLATATAGNLKLTWNDCGDSNTKAKITSFSPSELTLGQTTTMIGTGNLGEDVTAANFDVEMNGAFHLLSCKGDASQSKTCGLPLGTGKLTFDAMALPIKAGQTQVKVDLTLSGALPGALLKTTTKATATASNGDKLFCLEIHSASEDSSEEVAQDYPTPDGKTMINDDHLISWYNSANGATWVAGHNDFFNGMTFDDARPILGTALSHISEHLNNTLSDSVYAALGDAPAEFDARTKWTGLIHPIRNQLHCGSCWAFSASEVLSDRVAIANGKESPVLSAEDLVSCDKADMGCRGGRLSTAWDFIKNDGLVTETCFPYAAGGGDAPACRTTCVDSEAFTRTKAMSAYAISGLTNMQKEMSTNGPIQVAFMVYKSFMSYKSGVYQKHWWEFTPEGGHAVKMIGWGSESGTDYWLVANSWGTTQWGEGGFFKIKRGANECGIESMGPPYAGMPAKNVVVV